MSDKINSKGQEPVVDDEKVRCFDGGRIAGLVSLRVA